MATVVQVADASLQRILVQGSESQREPDEYQDFIFAMNNYMLDLDANGVALGYTEVSNVGDDITIPTGALRGLIANMAIEVAADYHGQVTTELARVASEGLKTMRLLGQRIVASAYPCTLPRGSGNDGWLSRSQTFYPDSEAEILAETTGAIGLEISTNTVLNNG